MKNLPDGIEFDGEIYWSTCPKCGRKQGDMGNNMKCWECGYTPMPHKPRIAVIYPYSAKKSKWHEINYSIGSIKKNFMEPHKIFIMGEDNPKIPDTQYIYHYDNPTFTTEQNNGGKLKKCAATFDKFIWMNDDFYLLKPTDATQIMTNPPLRNMADYKSRGTNRWHKLLWNTFDMLKEAGIDPIFNFATHTPQFYISKNLTAAAKQFPIFEGKVLVETVYFNLFRPWPLMTSQEKAGFYTPKQSQNQEQLKEKFMTCRYLNHDDRGLTPNLKDMIIEHFGTM